MLVAATPGLALAAFVAGMTLPYPGIGAGLAVVGVLAVFGTSAVGLVMTRVTEVLTQTKPLRIWMVVSAAATTTSLSTLYTDYPEVSGLLTSLSSVVFTVAVVASGLMVTFAVVQIEQSVRSWGTVSPELPA